MPVSVFPKIWKKYKIKFNAFAEQKGFIFTLFNERVVIGILRQLQHISDRMEQLK